MTTVGIDIHSQFYQVCLLNDCGLKEEVALSTDSDGLKELYDKVNALPECRVAMEACTGAHQLYEKLNQHTRALVFIVDARKVRERFPKRGRKTDKIDAHNLAKLAGYENIEAIWVPSPEIRELRLLTHERCKTVEHRTQEMNRIHAYLKEFGHKYPGNSTHLWSVEGRQWLSKRMLKMSPSLASVIDTTLVRLDLLDEQVLQLEHQLVAWCQGSDEAKLLMTVPGASAVGAAVFLAEVGDWKRFSSSKKLTRFAGLDPCVTQSATDPRYGKISKQGRPVLRWVLTQLTLTAVRHNVEIKQFYDRVRKKTRNLGKAKVAAARKMLVIFWNILKSGRPYNYERKKLTMKKSAHHQRIVSRLAGRRPTGRGLKGLFNKGYWHSEFWCARAGPLGPTSSCQH